jgi:hypothetical protein
MVENWDAQKVVTPEIETVVLWVIWLAERKAVSSVEKTVVESDERKAV